MHVLFVCTGNIFRSLTAEYALRRALPPDSGIVIGSAGTEDFPHVVKPVVADYLARVGLDVGGHRRRTLTAEMLDEADLVVAMSWEHRDELEHRFGIDVPLFAEACGFGAEPLPDVDEAVADHRDNPAAVAAHVAKTIDRIIELTPYLATRIMPVSAR
jgi:protein-tyrosine phosphatase